MIWFYAFADAKEHEYRLYFFQTHQPLLLEISKLRNQIQQIKLTHTTCLHSRT